MTKRYLSLTVALLPAVLLSGCLSFGGKPPKVLLTINSTAALPVGSTQNSASAKTVTIQVPVVRNRWRSHACPSRPATSSLMSPTSPGSRRRNGCSPD